MRKLILVFILSTITALFSCQNNDSKNNNLKDTLLTGDLIIFHAGSLSLPIKKISEEFKKHYPEVNIMTEASGSVECARKITELNKPCDIIASADYTVIDKMLIPERTTWNIKFASNEMVIAFTEKSLKQQQINSNNWFDILLDAKVLIGRSDPNSDPCGYRTVQTLKLADKYYKQTISHKIISKNTENIRPKEVDLLALLESHTIDYIFIYRSIAEQHKLKYIILPDEINLKKSELNSLYNTVEVEVNGKKPGEKIVQKGEAMVYGLSILKNSQNIKVAKVFVEFMLNENKGMKTLIQLGQPSVIPSQSNGYDSIPENLKKFAKP